MAAFGGIAFIKGIVGFGVAIKHDRRILFGYNIAVGVIIFGQIVAIGSGYVLRGMRGTNIDSMLVRTLEESYNGAVMHGERIMAGGSKIDKAWDFVMARSR